MNNWTMNYFHSVVYLLLLLSPLAIYQVTSWFLLNNIQLVLTSRDFPQTFSPDLLGKIFCHSEHFVKNEKDGNHLVQGLMNMVDGVE